MGTHTQACMGICFYWERTDGEQRDYTICNWTALRHTHRCMETHTHIPIHGDTKMHSLNADPTKQVLCVERHFVVGPSCSSVNLKTEMLRIHVVTTKCNWHSRQDMSQCQSWRCNRTLFFKACERVFPLQPLTVKSESSVVSSPSHSAFHRNMVVGVVTAPVLFSSNTWANQEAHFNLLFSPLSQTTPFPFLSRPHALCSAWSRGKKVMQLCLHLKVNQSPLLSCFYFVLWQICWVDFQFKTGFSAFIQILIRSPL